MVQKYQERKKLPWVVFLLQCCWCMFSTVRVIHQPLNKIVSLICNIKGDCSYIIAGNFVTFTGFFWLKKLFSSYNPRSSCKAELDDRNL